MIATTETNAFQFHGLGPAYGADQGKVVFYLQTTANVGSNGRGTGQVRSKSALSLNETHTIVVEKTLTSLSISVNGERNTVWLPESVSAGQFEIKPTGQMVIAEGVGSSELVGCVESFQYENTVSYYGTSQG